jgi:hypothetical protein
MNTAKRRRGDILIHSGLFKTVLAAEISERTIREDLAYNILSK